jgi:hypothetical protein
MDFEDLQTLGDCARQYAARERKARALDEKF